MSSLNNKSELLEASERLLGIHWDLLAADPEIDYSAMIGEYIRRVAVLSESMDLAISSPFFSPIDLGIPDGDSASRQFDRVSDVAGGSRTFKNAYLRRACEFYLQWAEAVDSRNVIAISAPDLFDPLISLIEAGGSFGLHHGEVLTDNAAFPLRSWKSFASLAPIIFSDEK